MTNQNDNFTQLKRLFEAECAHQKPSRIFAKLLDGRPISRAKRSLISAVRLIEESRVNMPTPCIERKKTIVQQLLSLDEEFNERMTAKKAALTRHE